MNDFLDEMVDGVIEFFTFVGEDEFRRRKAARARADAQRFLRELERARDEGKRERERRERCKSCWRVALTTVNGKPVIHEYRDRRRTNGLTYRVAGGRNYYQAGDVVLTSKMSERWVRRVIPSVNRRADGGVSVLSVLAEVFQLRGEYNVGWRIKNIHPANDGTGNGAVTVASTILFGGGVAAEFETASWSRSRLSWEFEQAARLGRVSFILGATAFAVDVLFIPASGGVRSLAKRFARRVARRQLLRLGRIAGRRFVSLLIAVIRSRLTPIVQTFLVEYVKEISRLVSENELRADAGVEERRNIYQQAITKAAGSAADKFIGNLFSEAVKQMSPELRSEIEYASVSITLRAGHALAMSIAEIFTIDAFRELIRVTTKALAESQDGRGTFGERFRQAVDLEKFLVGKLRSKFATIAGTTKSAILESSDDLDALTE